MSRPTHGTALCPGGSTRDKRAKRFFFSANHFPSTLPAILAYTHLLDIKVRAFLATGPRPTTETGLVPNLDSTFDPILRKAISIRTSHLSFFSLSVFCQFRGSFWFFPQLLSLRVAMQQRSANYAGKCGCDKPPRATGDTAVQRGAGFGPAMPRNPMRSEKRARERQKEQPVDKGYRG